MKRWQADCPCKSTLSDGHFGEFERSDQPDLIRTTSDRPCPNARTVRCVRPAIRAGGNATSQNEYYTKFNLLTSPLQSFDVRGTLQINVEYQQKDNAQYQYHYGKFEVCENDYKHSTEYCQIVLNRIQE